MLRSNCSHISSCITEIPHPCTSLRRGSTLYIYALPCVSSFHPSSVSFGKLRILYAWYHSRWLHHVLLDESTIWPQMLEFSLSPVIEECLLGASFSLDLQMASSRSLATPVFTCRTTNRFSASSSPISIHHLSSSNSAAADQGGMPKKVYKPSMMTRR